ncbi:oligosaccharide repeat unit polymerase [Yersinia pseudotuberculosis]|uniref:oligosaccharide repeat unit polymerase n=1 Tax=Yersinia pseudotuberculosis TaxID=633 RepID=UPI000349103E|nr:oligosaccharide repeat unit polymerase [Yersinia pseudotuberculosis]CFU85061.1 O-antigen biosynthesis protein Wxy [Yersinia pseudotuberculosis]CNB20350.1 O-antigen biosynthesis protein Wxy [Yersinia pseudotuberculosis]CNB24422.1 O-antigen biosynthesis protein Wxy [Yersinia pseudotuberculosis]CRY58112.1 O-antigen biosynthesis protein Wxy [Yersinia pseudotuberculosis]
MEIKRSTAEKSSINKTIVVFTSLYSIALWINFIVIINSGKYSADLQGIDVGINTNELLYIALVNQLFLLMAVFIFNILNSRNIKIGNLRFEFNKDRFSVFFFIILILNMVFFFSTGVGKVYSTKTHYLKTLFIILEPGNIFFLYYLIVRNTGSKLFFVNVVLYSILQISKGWTSFILIIGVFELYFFILRNNKSKLFRLPFIFSVIIPLLLFTGGSVAYKYAFLVKNEIRGSSVESVSLDYIGSTVLLASRLSNYNVAAGFYSKLDDVVNVVRAQEEFSELKSFSQYFLPVRPNEIEARPLSNSSMLAFYPTFGAKYSNVEIGMFTYYQILSNVDIYEAVFVLFITFFMLLFFFSFYKLIANNENVELLLFIMVFYFLFSMCSPTYFIRPYALGVLFIPFFVVFGILKIKRNLNYSNAK